MDNGRGGGFETLFGDHCITMNGRCYSVVPMAGGTRNNGISTFLFDGVESTRRLDEQVSNVNKQFLNIRGEFLRKLFDEMRMNSRFAQELEYIGSHLCRKKLNGQYQTPVDVKAVAATLNGRKNGLFDVGSLTIDNGDRGVVVGLHIKGKTKTMDLRDPELLPLMYPLMFPYGEDQWCLAMEKDLPLYDYLKWIIFCPEKTNSFDEEVQQQMRLDKLQQQRDRDAFDAQQQQLIAQERHDQAVAQYNPNDMLPSQYEIVSRLKHFKFQYYASEYNETVYSLLSIRLGGVYTEFDQYNFGQFYHNSTMSARNMEDFEAFSGDRELIERNRCFFIHLGMFIKVLNVLFQ